MFLGNSFGTTLDVLHRSMDVNMLRQDVIADNIANSDTPNFKRREVNFESSLEAALSYPRRQELPLSYTHPRHIPFDTPPNYRDVRPRVRLDDTTTSKNNGNNVDIEVESMHFLSAQLAYQLMSDAVRAQFANANIALRG